MTAPVGVDYGSPGAVHNYDEAVVHLENLAPLALGARVTARVFFQSTMRAFIEELASANITDQRGSDLKRVWQDNRLRSARLVKEQTLELQVLTAGNGGGGGSGGTTSNGGAAIGGSGGASTSAAGTPPIEPSHGAGCSVQRGSPCRPTWFDATLVLIGLFVVRSRTKRRGCVAKSSDE